MTPTQLLGALAVFAGVLLGQRAATTSKPEGAAGESRPSVVAAERREYIHVR